MTAATATGRSYWLDHPFGRLPAVGSRDNDPAVIYGGRQPAQPFAICVECRRISGPYWIRWRACRIDEPESDEEPEIALYCPACAEREFGLPRCRPIVDRRKQPR